MDAVRLAGKDPDRTIEERGLGTADNPTFEGMHEASAHVVGATVEAARRVWTGEALHAANISGGLHHAMPDKASGFCVYNDVAVGIRWLLDQGAERVAYVDVDVHHGDGVREGVLRRPAGADHQPPRDRPDAVPGHRLPQRHRRSGSRGQRGQRGAAAGYLDAGWLRAFHAVVPPLVREFAPDVLVTQQGCDSPHRGPAGAPDADRRRAAGDVPRAARARARGLRRPVAGDRGRRLRRGRRRAPGLDPPARGGRRERRWTRRPRRRSHGGRTSRSCSGGPARSG